MAEVVETQRQDVEMIVAKVCDRCGARASADEQPMSVEFNEFVPIRWTAGYGSIFIDGDTYAVDLCQRCVKELLGPFSRVTHQGPVSSMPNAKAIFGRA